MSTLDQAIETQLKNIEIKAGKPRGELKSLLRATGLTKHTELREHAQSTFGLGHGDANALVHFACASSGTFAFEGKSDDAVLDEIYTSAKAALRQAKRINSGRLFFSLLKPWEGNQYPNLQACV